jgi:lysophospholipase L1-like esterase
MSTRTPNYRSGILPVQQLVPVGQNVADDRLSIPAAPRTVTVNAPGATPSINIGITEIAVFTGLAADITSMTTNLTGTPYDGQLLEVDLTDNGTQRAVTWGASFEAGDSVPVLPNFTTASTRLRCFFYYNASTSAFRCYRVDGGTISASSTRQLIIEGDSISYGYGNRTISTTKTYTKTVTAVSGRTLVDMWGQRYKVAQLFAPNAGKSVVVVMGGINDWSLLGATATQIFDRLARLCAYYKSLGFFVIVNYQTSANVNSTSYDSTKSAVNSDIATYYTQFAHIANPLSTLLTADNAFSDGTYFQTEGNGDKLHPTAAGSDLICSSVGGRVDANTLIGAEKSCFSAHKNAVDQTGITHDSATKLTFGFTTINLGGHFDTTNSKWTPPAGNIEIYLNVSVLGTNVTGRVFVEVFKNGSLFRNSYNRSASGVATCASVVCKDIATGTDYYEAYVYVEGSGNISVEGGTTVTIFEGKMIGG